MFLLTLHASSLFATGVLRNANELCQALLSSPQVAKEFDFTATVTCVLSLGLSGKYVAVSDPRGDVRVYDSNPQNNLAPGDSVRLQGRTTTFKRTSALPQAQVTNLMLMKHGPAPQPVHSTIEELHGGGDSWRFVRIKGLVRDVHLSETSPNWIILVLCSHTRSLYVSMPAIAASVERLREFLGRTVALDGFSDPLTGACHIYAGAHFHCPGLSAIHPVSADTDDPFQSPDIGTLVNKPPDEIAAMGRVRAHGRVLCTWREGNALVKLPNDEVVHLFIDGNDLPARNASIEACGLPQSDFINLKLVHAQWREAAPLETPNAETLDITALSAMTDSNGCPHARTELHGRTVRLSGTVRAFPDRTLRKSALVLDDGGILFFADISSLPDIPAGLSEGYTVRVTGTCVMEAEYWHPGLSIPQIRDFTVVVSEPDGIIVTTRPPWWTPKRIWTVVGILLVALLGVLIWSRGLQVLVVRKGRELMREQLGHVRAHLKTEERTRLAVDLHDALSQNLTGIALQLNLVKRLAGKLDSKIGLPLDIALRTLQSCRNELRACIWDLRNQALDEPSLEDAIRKTLLPHLDATHLSLRFKVPRSRLDDNLTHTLLRIIRELVCNAVRHGQSQLVKVAGTLDGGRIFVSVQDDGLGFDPKNRPDITEGHFGLDGIRERIRAFHGEMNIESAPGRGTKVIVSLAIQQPET